MRTKEEIEGTIWKMKRFPKHQRSVFHKGFLAELKKLERNPTHVFSGPYDGLEQGNLAAQDWMHKRGGYLYARSTD